MGEQRASGTATVMFTDVESSTDITTRLGDDAAASLLATHNTIVLDQVAAFGGHDVRSTGDGFLVVFDSARAAVSCALAIQRQLTEREHPIRVRIGLNAGEVLHSGDELFGAAINLAARVMDRADGGEILTTDTVRQLVGTMTDASFRDRGRVALKGFAERQRLYEVRPAEVRPAVPPAPRRPPRRSRRTRMAAGAVVLLAAAAAAVALLDDGSGSPPAVVVAPNSVAVIDPGKGAVVATIPVDENPGPITAGAGGVWVLNQNSATLSYIDVETRTPRRHAGHRRVDERRRRAGQRRRVRPGRVAQRRRVQRRPGRRGPPRGHGGRGREESRGHRRRAHGGGRARAHRHGQRARRLRPRRPGNGGLGGDERPRRHRADRLRPRGRSGRR